MRDKVAYKIDFLSPFYPEITLAEQLEIAASKYGEKTALIYAEPKFPIDVQEKMTFKELNDMTNKLASSLIELGIKKGERVGICIPNSPDYVVSVYALWKIGAVVVPINPMYKEIELEYVLNDSEATAIIIHNLNYPVFENIREKAKVQEIVTCGNGELRKLIKSGTGEIEKPEILPKEDLVVFAYTGGTTGMPKGVMLTHYNLVSMPCNLLLRLV